MDFGKYSTLNLLSNPIGACLVLGDKNVGLKEKRSHQPVKHGRFQESKCENVDWRWV